MESTRKAGPGKIEAIKRKYNFGLKKIWPVPVDIVKRFGKPVKIELVGDGWLILFKNAYTKTSILVLFSPGFHSEKIILQSNNLNHFFYNPLTDCIGTVEVNISDLYGGNKETAFADKRNRIVEYDMDGKVANVLVSGEQGEIFPLTAALLDSRHLVYHDLVPGEIKIADMQGKVLRRIDVGKRLVKYFKVPGSQQQEIYFNSISQKNYFNWKTGEVFESIYKIDCNNIIQHVFQSPLKGLPADVLYDFEPLTDGIFYVFHQGIGKVDLKGVDIFKISMVHPFWRECQECYLISLSKIKAGKNDFFAVAHTVKQEYYLLDLEL